MREEQGTGVGIGAAVAVGCGVIMLLLGGLGFMMFSVRSSSVMEMHSIEAEALAMEAAIEAQLAEDQAAQAAEEAREAAPGVRTGVRLTLVGDGIEEGVYMVRAVDGTRVRLQLASDGEDELLWVDLELVESWTIVE